MLEIGDLSELKREVFGPVLHVLRYQARPAAVIDADQRHRLRPDPRRAHPHRRDDPRTWPASPPATSTSTATSSVPWSACSPSAPRPRQAPAGSNRLRRLAGRSRKHHEAARCRGYIEQLPHRYGTNLPGPVGERNLYGVHPRGTLSCPPQTETGLLLQIGAPLATGNEALIPATSPSPICPRTCATTSPPPPDWTTTPKFQAVLFEGDSDALRDLNRQLATALDPIVSPSISRDALASCAQDYGLVPLVEEQSVSTDTAAAGEATPA